MVNESISLSGNLFSYSEPALVSNTQQLTPEQFKEQFKKIEGVVNKIFEKVESKSEISRIKIEIRQSPFLMPEMKKYHLKPIKIFLN